MAVITLRPFGIGSKSEHVAVGDTPNYKCVDEAVADDDTTRVTLTEDAFTVATATDLYVMDRLDTDGVITNVTMFYRAGYDVVPPEHGRIIPVVFSGGIEYQAAFQELVDVYIDYSEDYGTECPDGRAWTPDILNECEFGFTSDIDNTDGFTVVQSITQFYVEVTVEDDHECFVFDAKGKRPINRSVRSR